MNSIIELKKNIVNNILYKDGYSLDLKLQNKEFKLLKEIVFNHLCDKIKKYKIKNKLNKFHLNSIHTVEKKINYEKFIIQKNRILNKEDYLKISNLPFYKKIKKIFKSFHHVSNGPFAKKYGQFIIRVVRPKNEKDVGPIHADKWFFDLNKKEKHYRVPKFNETNIKFWIPICLEIKKSGLIISKKSQFKNYKYKYKSDIVINKKKKLIHKKPIFDHKRYFKTKFNIVKSNPGQIVIFTDKLLHGGTNKFANKTRVSIEFSIITKKKNLSLN